MNRNSNMPVNSNTKNYRELTQIDDEIMARIVEFKHTRGMYPTLLELEQVTQFKTNIIAKSLINLSKLGKVLVLVINDKFNPLITG